jgi:uncharacterized protein with LGFP repeats
LFIQKGSEMFVIEQRRRSFPSVDQNVAEEGIVAWYVKMQGANDLAPSAPHGEAANFVVAPDGCHLNATQGRGGWGVDSNAGIAVTRSVVLTPNVNYQLRSPGSVWNTKVVVGTPDANGLTSVSWHASTPSACTGDFPVAGGIGAHYTNIDGVSIVGRPLGFEFPINGGWRQNFTGGSIVWTPNTGARSIRDEIFAKWAGFGGEAWGFPITDENTTPDGIGRYNHFRGPDNFDRSIYWKPGLGAFEVRGAIRDTWSQQGWENGPLGYPTSDEQRIFIPFVLDTWGQFFEHGFVAWNGSIWATVILPD